MGAWNVGDDGAVTTKTNDGDPGGDGLAVDCAGRDHAADRNQLRPSAVLDGKTLIVVTSGMTSVQHQRQMAGACRSDGPGLP